MTSTPNVRAALDRLTALHPKKIDLSLGRVERLLAALGDPHRAMPPVIHVAGTNGKGSTVAILRAMAEAAGLKVHAFTSPHLVRFAERIRLAGRIIEDEALVTLLQRVEDANAGEPITFFESTTAAAFLAMAETPAELALIVVGMGGRYDATNIFPAPACAVITPVGMDHEQFLGSDLATIAREKAGIIKSGQPLVVAPQEPPARAMIASEAQTVGADPVLMWGTDFDARLDAGRLFVETQDEAFDLPAPRLMGPHQVINAGVAVMAARASGLIPREGLNGLANAAWPGRLQSLTEGEAFRQAVDGGAGEVWLAGAHNPQAAAALARALADLDDRNPRPLVLIMGMQPNKDAATIFAAYAGLAREVITVPLQHAAGAPADILAETARTSGVAARPAASLRDALRDVRVCVNEDEPAPRVAVTGSLYLVGEALGLDEGLAREHTAG